MSEYVCVCHMFDFDDSINDVQIFKRNQPNGIGELLAIRTNKPNAKASQA